MHPRLEARLERAARLAYGFAAALAALVLWGWALNLTWLRDLGAHFPPMPPAAALGILLLAAGFLAAERGRTRIACIAAVLAGAIAAFQLAGFPAELMPWRPSAASAAPMSPAAALGMLLLAIATPLRGDRRLFGVSVSNAAAGVVALLAFFALLGMSLRMLRFDLAAPLLGFSAPGALAELLGAFALAAARLTPWTLEVLTGRGTGAVVTRWLLPAAFAVPIAVG